MAGRRRGRADKAATRAGVALVGSAAEGAGAPTPLTVPELAVPDFAPTVAHPPMVGVPGLEDVSPVQLRAVQESLLDPSLVLRAKRRPDGRIVDFVCEDANEAAADSLEVPRVDLLGSTLTVTLPGPLGEFLFDQCVEAVDTGVPLSFDDLRTAEREDGTTGHYDIRAVAVGDRVCFTWREVTERFRIQEALAESRNRYRLLAEHSSDVVALVRPDGVLEWVSPSVRDLLGWEPEELVGRDSAELVHPEDHRRRMAVHRHPATVQPGDDEVRCRRAAGDYAWVSSRMREVKDGDGRLVNVVVSLRDVHTQVLARQALVASEERYRLLAEHVSDVVYQVLDGRVAWVSPSVERVLGWRPADMVGRPSFDFIVAEDLDRAATARAAVVDGRLLEAFECRFRTASGGHRWMRAHARAVDAGEGHYGLVAGLQDIHEGYGNRVALEALAAVNAALVGADDEERLVADVCRLVVEVGGFASARYRRAGEPDAGTRSGEFDVQLPVSVDGRVDGTLAIASDEPDVLGPQVVATLGQLAHQMGMAIAMIRTREQLVSAFAEQQLLSTAIEQASESVVVTDLDRRILYANPATAASSGYALDEIIGADPELFVSGLHGPDFYAEIGRALATGDTWRGVVTNRTKDGELRQEDVTVTPVRDDTGTVVNHVTVRRDISRELRLESDLVRLRSDRDSVVRAMDEVRVGSTVEASATSFCEAAARLDDVEVARVLLVEPDDTVVPLGITGTAYLGWQVGVPVRLDHLPQMLDVIRDGSWWLDLDGVVVGGPGSLIQPSLLDTLRSAGFRSVGFAPIWWEERMVGVLTLTSRHAASGTWVEARLALADELGSYAGRVLGAQIARRSERRVRTEEVRDVIDRAAFHPVFQPVVDLTSGAVLGYEALTRFTSGVRPDLVIGDAHEVGLGVELETACALAAVRAAAALPPGRWVAVNFSPVSVTSGAVPVVTATADRPVVVEITEHVEVASYAEVRTAVESCAGVRISVDDAGAGYASLRHILELQPEFVKLDIGLVRGIDADPARQALAAGLRHYAEQTGTTLIAEGVETAAERDTLLRLGIPLAQGYLFGRPDVVGSLDGDPLGRSEGTTG